MGDRIGFIGFGEVGFCFAEAMTRAGASVTAYDLLLENPEKGARTRQMMARSGAESGSLADVIQHSDYVLSTVTNKTAEEVARTCAASLRPGQAFLDMNSTSPATKIEISRIIVPSGAEFVEAAILGAIGATGPQTRILLGGQKASEAAEVLERCGLNASFYSPEIGKASMFKMLRSIFSKGLETLIIELLVAGKRAGIESDLWEDITGFMAGKPFDKIAGNWVQTHATAYDRRYYEMVQVLETMDEIGLDPVMTSATTRFFERSLSLGFEKIFTEKPAAFQDVIDFMESRLKSSKMDS